MPRRIDPGAEIVPGDPDRLEQALQNLAGNALRYTPDGGEVSLTAMPRDKSVVITVRDSGPGIPDTQLPLIFDRFYKSGDSHGTGLGLAIARNLVVAHGGEIVAQNNEGASSGATIRISLPLT